MNTQTLLYTKVNSLPERLQKEVLDFIDFLLSKNAFVKSKKSKPAEKKNRKPGSAKGIIKYMSDDFDEPLDDLKEYMY